MHPYSPGAASDGPQHPFHPELEQAIDVLKEAIAKENWEVKGKFPQGLKPLLSQVALKAVILGEYDDNFFNLMPRLFPYNKFTMTVRYLCGCARIYTMLMFMVRN